MQLVWIGWVKLSFEKKMREKYRALKEKLYIDATRWIIFNEKADYQDKVSSRWFNVHQKKQWDCNTGFFLFYWIKLSVTQFIFKIPYAIAYTVLLSKFLKYAHKSEFGTVYLYQSESTFHRLAQSGHAI